MNHLSTLLEKEAGDLIGALDPYQVEIINSFLEATSEDYLTSADKWLNAVPANTAVFGGVPGSNKPYRDKLLEELEKFLCGDIQYEEDRNKIAASKDHSEKYLIGVLSAAIGPVVGAAGAFIAPVLVLLILSLGKIPLNAWCSMRKDQRNEST